MNFKKKAKAPSWYLAWQLQQEEGKGVLQRVSSSKQAVLADTKIRD